MMNRMEYGHEMMMCLHPKILKKRSCNFNIKKKLKIIYFGFFFYAFFSFSLSLFAPFQMGRISNL